MPTDASRQKVLTAISSALFCENWKKEFVRAASSQSSFEGLYRYPYRADNQLQRPPVLMHRASAQRNLRGPAPAHQGISRRIWLRYLRGNHARVNRGAIRLDGKARCGSLNGRHVEFELRGCCRLNNNATCAVRGEISFNSPTHLPSVVGSTYVKPVMLPPGRARLGAKPLPIGSATTANTIGIVNVSCRPHRPMAQDEKRGGTSCPPRARHRLGEAVTGPRSHRLGRSKGDVIHGSRRLVACPLTSEMKRNGLAWSAKERGRWSCRQRS